MAAVASLQTAFVATNAKAAPRARPAQRLVVRAQQGVEQPAAKPLQLLAPLAAAALALTLHAGEAQAGVVLVQPEVKNFVKGTSPSKSSGSNSSGGAPAAKKVPRPSEMSGAPDLRFLALPAAVVGIAAAGAAATKIDSGFAAVLDKGSLRDSNILGVGYEANSGLKDSYFFVEGGSKEVQGVKGAGRAPAKAQVKKAGTILKKAGTTVKKAGTISLFGNRD